MKEDAEKDKGNDNNKIWGAILFGFIGATVTTFAVGQLRRSAEWFYTQLSRTQSSWKGESGGSFRSAFQEEAWRRHNKRMQEELEEEIERVERIRRMQSVFNRERNKYKRSYESWRESGPGAYHQHSQREDWYWKADTSFRDKRTNYRETPRESGNYALSHHYSVLGLDRFRKTPYSEAEIKTAFRTKAKEYHPDQNQDNIVAAESKFKEVLTSYEAIKQERRNHHT
ncbi:hypothetical protein AAZX31_04G047700 [Glycine max]|uniref:J domain-containing protein n=1 Tax=Glycine max TaxID=3847 RepID=I1JTT6_SOYBN|nr:uncharacterized protein LOC100812371 [Glycine max]XP_006578069.1 uncharacterized protein LOC100812371 [Glycine max]XP_014629958.1 uncharacterized protein LOC100812371 [Glycine max]KAG5048236.1 hypothetical protein JHK85_009339 [Glycine max]KAG5065355.1 hypothetical protein JHK86_009086 [Glycine max]KAH1109811.1 hypothetical protein GYH30_008956 [Glycine max]KAH1109812.1 hypothetical protein GYH30_008956 [Glycine max]KRH61455.1 hypothetical protein GLYMA_04G048400v4 [Glycine max]|eukprot:XP_003524043.1 uncharacterized protein LOC100812371 [Glycine max]